MFVKEAFQDNWFCRDILLVIHHKRTCGESSFNKGNRLKDLNVCETRKYGYNLRKFHFANKFCRNIGYEISWLCSKLLESSYITGWTGSTGYAGQDASKLRDLMPSSTISEAIPSCIFCVHILLVHLDIQIFFLTA